MKTAEKKLDVLLVVRNEEEYIEECLNSIIAQNIPDDSYRIIIIDGMSEDNTISIVRRILEKTEINFVILENAKKILASGWNTGVAMSDADFIIRIDAHTLLPPDFFSKKLDFLENNREYSIIGGRWPAKGKTITGNAIAVLQNSLFGVGNSPFRTSGKAGESETAVNAMLRSEVYAEMEKPYYNEKLGRGQDLDFYRRAREAGFRIYFDPGIKSTYYCRNSIKAILRQSLMDGMWHVFNIKAVRPRHLTPFFFFLYLLLLPLNEFINLLPSGLFLIPGILYLVLALIFTIYHVITEKDISLLFLLPILYFIIHVSYGCGTALGILRKTTGTGPKKLKDKI